mgnify:CR=1 FL=1
MFLTVLIGIAKPILSIEASLLEPEDEYFALVMPTTSPLLLNSASADLIDESAAGVAGIDCAVSLNKVHGL